VPVLPTDVYRPSDTDIPVYRSAGMCSKKVDEQKKKKVARLFSLVLEPVFTVYRVKIGQRVPKNRAGMPVVDISVSFGITGIYRWWGNTGVRRYTEAKIAISRYTDR